MKIAVSGSTGFVGKHLIKKLLEDDFKIIGLTRSHCVSSSAKLEFRTCDLYSLLDAERSLEGCDVAIYLVHSMNHSVRLSQGTFDNFDFLLADNFAKACERNEVKRIIYVSGILPYDKLTSAHLRSRFEVEKTLKKHKTPLTVFRTGIVLGPEGSSFDMIRKIINRLPIIFLPSWTLNKIQVLSIKDLVDSIVFEIKTNNSSQDGSFDLAHPKVFRYAGLIKKIARKLGKRNIFIKFPFIPNYISKHWISFITGHPKALVYPLVESLKYSMIVKEERIWPNKKDFQSIDESILWSWNEKNSVQLPISRKTPIEPNRLVRSVQRLPVPEGWTMNEVALEYMNWLDNFFKAFLKIERNGDLLHFCSIFIRKPLLTLEFSRDRTFETRELFYIVGGVLARPRADARLEFRESPEKDFFIAAIHNYNPSLPWYVYRYTQALVHAFVMKKFGKHLRSLSKKRR
jgi:nucleoside-diphosphate-sugar epimerase